MTFLAASLLLGPATVLPVRAQDEWEFDLDAAVHAGQQLVAGLEDAGFDLSALADAPPPQDWAAYWSDLEAMLQEGSVEDLAWLSPYARQGLAWLDSVAGAEPYADWLRQRLDYFEVAEEAVRETAPTPPPPPPRIPPRIVVPPPRPPARLDPVQVERAEQRMADHDVWKKKLARRPPPARASALLPRMRKIFREEGVPESLVWMAEVESTFDPTARSPVGAVGLYQLMPATAERFGLRVKPIDERKHPDKNARAAARYLGHLYRNFTSWPLALAAYNAGEGRVRRTLRERGGATFEDIARHLPSETRLYVPKVLATIELRDGSKLARGASEPGFGGVLIALRTTVGSTGSIFLQNPFTRSGGAPYIFQQSLCGP